MNVQSGFYLPRQHQKAPFGRLERFLKAFYVTNHVKVRGHSAESSGRVLWLHVRVIGAPAPAVAQKFTFLQRTT